MINIRDHVIVKFVKLSATAKKPQFKMDGDSCADMYADEKIHIQSGETEVIKTNIAFELPLGWEMLTRGRSSFNKNGFQVLWGTIDSGYRGEVGFVMANHNEDTLVVQVGDRIGQIAVRKVPRVTFDEVNELEDSERGTGGYGSTGVNDYSPIVGDLNDE